MANERLRWTQPSPGVFQSSAFGEAAVLDPSGTCVAYTLPRDRPVPLREREAVYVDTLDAGQIAALHGVSNVRAVHWVRDDRLLVARDGNKGMHLELFELPFGEAVAQTFLPGKSECRFAVTQTPDARTLRVSHVPESFRPDEMPVYLVDAGSLAWRAVCACRDGDVVLHPDGASVAHARTVYLTASSHIARTRETVTEVSREPGGATLWCDTSPGGRPAVRWAGPHRVVIVRPVFSSEAENTPAATTKAGTFRYREVDTRDGAVLREAVVTVGDLHAWDVSPDGAWLAVSSDVNAGEARVGRLAVLALPGGELRAAASPPSRSGRGRRAACFFSRDSGDAYFLCDGERLGVTRLDVRHGAVHSAEFPTRPRGENPHQVGPWLVDTRRVTADRMQLRRLDLRRLGPE